jgi:hypothetical protein
MTSIKIPLIVYFILAYLLMLPLLGPGYYLALDMQRGPNSYSDFQFNSFYQGAPNPYGAYLPLSMVFSSLSKVIPNEFLEKGLLFMILFLCGASAHYSLPKELGNSRYFAGFLYTLNPFLFTRFLAGHWSFMLSYAFWPISIKFFMDFLNKPNRDNLAKAALLTFAASISSHGVILLLLCYSVLFLFHISRSSSRLALIKQTAILAFFVLAMNLFWILPNALSFADTYTPASAEAYLADFGARGGDIPLPLALVSMHGFWRGGFTYTKDVFDLWYIPFFIIVIMALSGFFLLYEKNNLFAASLLIIFILGFLLALGEQSPLLWIFGATPLSFIFRDSQKFVGLIALSYSFLGAYGVHYIAQRFTDSKKTLLIVALISIPIIYNYGFFGFLDQIGPTQFPKDWEAADKIISADNSSTKILVLPLHLYATYTWVNSNQKTLGDPAGPFFSMPVITATNVETKHVYSDVNDSREQYLKDVFQSKSNNTAQMLAPLDIRYALLNKGKRETAHYLDILLYAPNISLVFEGPTIYLFRNELAIGSDQIESKYGPLFYVTLSLLLLSWIIVLFLVLNPSKVQILQLFGLGLVILFISSNGQLSPSLLGLLIILSLFGALYIAKTQKNITIK